MTNLEKMNGLVDTDVDKKTVVNWAYANRISLITLHFEERFEEMENSVEAFMETPFFIENMFDEFKIWDEFLDTQYVE